MAIAEGKVAIGPLSGSMQVLRVDGQGHATADPRVIERLDEILGLLRPKAPAPMHFMFMPNGMVAAFDARGHQVFEWQGTQIQVVTKLVRLLGPDVKLEIIGGAL